jgi:hypothetical protein
MRFESEEDLAREKVVTGIIEKNWNCETIKMPKWDIDLLLHRDGITTAYAEIKTYPNTNFEKYDNCFISVRKKIRLDIYEKSFPTLYVLAHCDHVSYIRVSDIVGEEKMLSRKNQREGAVNDTEMVVYFKRSLLKCICRGDIFGVKV